MRVLVTGGAGFIGSHIVDRLIERGETVLVVDDLSQGRRENIARGARFEQLDICAPEFSALVAEFRPDVVSHCAASASVPRSVADPLKDAETNILGGMRVVRDAVAAGCRQFVYLSTGGALYGEPVYLPCDEEHPIQPLSPYGLSKWTLERYLPLLLGPSARLAVLRLANVYGPRQDAGGEGGVIAIFASQMLRGEPATIFGDGDQTRDFVYVGDVVEAHERALHSPQSLTVNISSGEAVSVNQVYRLLAAQTGCERAPAHNVERPGDVRRSVIANTRARAVLGWQPRVPLRDGLRRTLDWLAAESAARGA